MISDGGDRDFTASTYIVDENKVLLLKHRKLGAWLQPGGHIEENELPHETAFREALEETGIKVEFESCPENKYREESYDLPIPIKINVHKIKEGHWHCDFAFLARIKEKREEDQQITHSHEHEGIRWFSKEELLNSELRIPENVRKTAIEVLEKAQKNPILTNPP